MTPALWPGTCGSARNRTGATIRMGRKAIPYAGWVEFGGTRRRPHITTREYIASGRYLFPAARMLQQSVGSIYEDAIADAFSHLLVDQHRRGPT